jgi:DNA-binding transcriptional LysR family regulator
MNLKQLEFALALAEERHFTRAAERCNVVQSALSHQIAHLEQELGATLFERSPRQVSITPAGDAFLANARQAMEAIRRAKEDVASVTGELRGTLTVGIISSVPILDIVDLIAGFHARFPMVDVQLRHDQSERLIEGVRERRVDFAVIGISRRATLEGIEKRLFLTEDLVAVLPVGHALAHRERLQLQDMVDLPLVDLPAGSGARRQTTEAFSALGLPHRVRFETTNMQLLEQFVRRGLAVGLVPQSIVASFSNVISVPVCDAPTRNVYAIWPKNPTPATRELLSDVENALTGISVPSDDPL